MRPVEFLGISLNINHLPELDPGFIPLYLFNRAFLADAKKPVSIAVERARGEMATYHTFIHGTPEMKDAVSVLMQVEVTGRSLR